MAPWLRVSSGAKIWQEIGQVVLSGAALRMWALTDGLFIPCWLVIIGFIGGFNDWFIGDLLTTTYQSGITSDNYQHDQPVLGETWGLTAMMQQSPFRHLHVDPGVTACHTFLALDLHRLSVDIANSPPGGPPTVNHGKGSHLKMS